VVDLLPPSFAPLPFWSTASSPDIIVRANGIEAGSRWWGLLPIVWTIGAITAVLALAAEALKLVRIAIAAERISDERIHQLAADVAHGLKIRRPVVLLQSGRTGIPVTWGVRRPYVMLPSSAAGWSDGRARAVLGHELAHIRRGDWLVHMLAEVACAIYWFHPFFWAAKRRLCRESEQAADDEVLGQGLDAGEFATHLLEIVRGAQSAPYPAPAVLAMARPSHLQRRLAALLDRAADRRRVTRAKALAAATAALLLSALLGAWTAPGAAMNIAIRTRDLPALASPPLLSSRAGEPTAVRGLRVVGGADASATTMPPEILEYTTPPLYSDEARARGIQGIVTVRARVGAGGRVASLSVVKGLGFGLDQNALVAIRQWKFRPAARGGVASPSVVEIDVEFSLQSEAVNELIANDMATRVGPGVTPPRAVRVLGLSNGPASVRGTVVLDVVLLEDGTPRIVRVLRSLAPELDERAIATFEQWRFSPATKDGRPVKVRMNAEVQFHG
jgi:TonB family protein